MDNPRTTVVIDMDYSGYARGQQSVRAEDARTQREVADNSSRTSATVSQNETKISTALERRIASMERLAVLAGKTGTDKMRAEADLFTKTLGDNEAAIQRVRAATEQRIQSEEKATAAARAAADAAKAQAVADREAASAQVQRAAQLRDAVEAYVAYAAIVKDLIVQSTMYAARNETLAIVTTKLAESNNLSVTAVERNVEAVKRQGITTQEARNTINQMIVAQLDVAKASDLARLAQNAAVVAGTNSSEALKTIIAGIVEQRVQMLRTVGISVSFEAAFERQAAVLGKSKDQLTEGEKKQIAFNVVLAQAPKLAGAYEAAMTTAGKQMGSLQRYTDEARAALGERFTPALGAVVNQLTSVAVSVKEHAGAYSTLAAAVGVAAAAFSTFKVVALLGIPGPVAIVAAALVGLVAVFELTRDKLSVQRDSISMHIESLKKQREELDLAGLSAKDYAAALADLDRREMAANVVLARNEADQRRAGQLGPMQFQGNLFSGPSSITGTPAQTFTLANGHVVHEGDYVDRLKLRADAGGRTFNQPLADQEAADAKAAAELAAGRLDRNKAAEEILATRRDLAAAQKQLASMIEQTAVGDVRGLSSPSQMLQLLSLGIDKVNSETQDKIEQRSVRVDDKTGTIRNFGLNPEAARNIEQQRLTLIDVETQKRVEADQKVILARRDAEFKLIEDAEKRRLQAENEISKGIEDRYAQMRDRRFDIASAAVDRSKGLTLQGFDLIQQGDPQEIIPQKARIEQQAAQQTYDIQNQRLQLQRTLDVGQTQSLLYKAGISPDDPRYNDAITAVTKDYDQQTSAAKSAFNDESTQRARQAQIETTQDTVDNLKIIFESLKSQAGSVLDALFSKSKNVFEAIGNALKNSLLSALKDVLATQFTSMLYNAIAPKGSQVSLTQGAGWGIIPSEPVFSGPGIATMSGIGRVSGAGSPQVMAARAQAFGASVAAPAVVSASPGIDASNFFGGGTLVPLDTNSGPIEQYSGDSGPGGGSPQVLAARSQLFGSGASSVLDQYGLPLWSSSTNLLPSAGGWGENGGPFGVGAGSPQVAAARAQSLSFGGGMAASGAHQSLQGSLIKSVTGGGNGGPTAALAKLKNSVYAPYGANNGGIWLNGDTNVTAGGISDSLGGGVLGTVAGGAAGFVASPAAAAIGTSLYLGGLSAKHQTLGTSAATVGGAGLAGAQMGANGQLPGGIIGGGITGLGVGLVSDGIKRGGGTGMVEDSAGGAMVGFEYGGPIGAAVGAAVGFAIGTVRLFITTQREKIINQAKSLYHLNLTNDGVIDQIQQMVKQNYGGNVEVAMRSKPVIDLLSLYANATGQKFGVQNTAQPLFLQETTKGTQQQAFYVDGSAYSWAGQLSTVGSVPTTQLEPYALGEQTNKQGGQYYSSAIPFQINNTMTLDPDTTQALMTGNTIQTLNDNPRVVTDASLASGSGNYNRTAMAMQQLTPGSLYM